MERIRLLQMPDPAATADEIGKFIIRCVKGAEMTGCVVGLSGGVDSTTAAALACRAFADGGLALVGFALPSDVSPPADLEDARAVAKRLGIPLHEIALDHILYAFQESVPDVPASLGGYASPFHVGNLISRIRGNVLSTEAAARDMLVLGTGNRDEDYGLGYYTLFGDGAVHLSPLGELPKRLVREMARFLGFADIADRTPSAGLEPGQTDFGDLGYSYETVELILEGLETVWLVLEDTEQAIHKLVQHPQILESVAKDITAGSRFADAQEVVHDVVRRRSIAKAKAEILHPPVAPVTTLSYD